MSEWQFEGEEEGGQVHTDEERVALAVRILKTAKEAIGRAIDVLDAGNTAAGREALMELLQSKGDRDELATEKVVEGVFDGERMIGSNGESYVVPVNYASKSRLVEGDMLKLSMRKDGAFVFKQIGPIERKRVTAKLAWDSAKEGYVAIEGDHLWKILSASVSFFKAQEGDTVVILVPKNAPSSWAAVENVVRA